jgi:hypothetical protein
MTQGRAAALAAALLAVVAIVVPFLIHALQDPDTVTSKVAHQTTQPATAPQVHHHTTAGAHDSALGSRTDLPALLPQGSPGLSEGQAVRLGDITTGTLHRNPTTGWHVLVRWDGRLQPLTTRGSASLGPTSWVSRAGLLYSRVATGTPGRFHVFAWSPQGGTVYTPPTLVATALGDVCFNQAFTDFGGCSG